MKQKTLFLTLGILVVVVVVVFAVVNSSSRQNGALTNKGQQKTMPVPEAPKVSDVAQVKKETSTEALAAFPAGFPVEAGAQSGNSYKYIPAKTTVEQSTVEYVSQKTLAQNGEIFRNYLAQAGFTIANKTEQTNWLFYYGTKGKEILSINLKADASGKVTVSASYVVMP